MKINMLSKIRPIRSYILRQGRLTKHQAEGIRLLSSLHAIPFEVNFLNWNTVFKNQSKKIIEIGFGMGNTTVEIAANLCDVNFIAVDVHSPGVGNLLNKIEEKKLTNLKVIHHDAVEVLEKMAQEKSLDAIHIFFPDPWHKKKHNKRRLIQEPFINLMAKKIKQDGYVHIATDWQDYALQILHIFGESKDFKRKNMDLTQRPSYRPKTKYEDRGLRLGHRVWDIIFIRR